MFFMLYCNEGAMTATFFTSNCKGVNNDTTKVNHCKDARDSCKGMALMAHHATTKYIICCQVQEATITSIYHVILQEKQWQLYFWCYKAVVLLEACDGNKLMITRCKDATIKHFVHCWSWGWRQRVSLSYRTKWQWWWLIAAKECKIALCNNQPNFYVALQGSKQWLQRHKAPAMKCIATTTLLTCDDQFLTLYFKMQQRQ